MSSQVEHASEALFGSDSPRLVGNVKFFRGVNREVTSEQLAEQLTRAQAQIESGQAERVSCVDG